MKYTLITVLVFLNAYTAVRLVEARLLVQALSEVDTSSDTFYGADLDGKDWQPIQIRLE